MRHKQLGQQECRGNPHPESIIEFLIGAFVDALEQGRRVVDQAVHPAMFCDHFLCKPAQRCFVTNVPYKIRVVCNVDDADLSASFLKFLPDTLSDTAGTAGNDDYFILKHGYSSVLIATLMTPSSRFSKMRYASSISFSA